MLNRKFDAVIPDLAQSCCSLALLLNQVAIVDYTEKQ